MFIKNHWLLPMLVAGLGSVMRGHLPAQTLTTLYSFAPLNNYANSDGSYPLAGLILSGNMLYGTAAEGGSSYNGTVFGVATDGTGFTTVHDFCDASYGELPVASLILSGNTLFGTTAYGGKANGTVFKVDTNGAGFVVLHSFTGMNDLTNSDGANPTAALILSRNTLYGTTAAGGSSGNGVVFKLNTDGTGFATLHSFAALNGTTNRDGASPLAGLTLLGDALYGTAAAAVLRAVARFSP